MLIQLANQQITVFQVILFNSRRATNYGSGEPDLGNLVNREEMGLGCWCASSTRVRRNGLWKDFHLSCSGNDLLIGDWGSYNGVATVHFMGEYPWKVGDCAIQWHSQHCWWRMGTVNVPEIEFCAPLPVGDPENSTRQASSSGIIPWLNRGFCLAWSGRHLTDSHWWEDRWNQF